MQAAEESGATEETEAVVSVSRREQIGIRLGKCEAKDSGCLAPVLECGVRAEFGSMETVKAGKQIRTRKEERENALDWLRVL